MLGGIRTAKDAGKSVPLRDEIYGRITALGEGAIFREDDICGGDEAFRDQFTLLRGHDYIHLANGWMTAIVETRHVRLIPPLEPVIEAWCAMRGIGDIVETGDRVAWRTRIKRWEPILGHRFYIDGESEYLAYGHHGVRLLGAPAWLRSEVPSARLLRVFHDTPEREIPEALERAITQASHSRETLEAVVAHARAIPFDRDTEPRRHIAAPSVIADRIESRLPGAAAREDA